VCRKEISVGRRGAEKSAEDAGYSSVSWVLIIPRCKIRADHAGTVETVTLTSRFQVVLLQRMREALGLSPGSILQAFQLEGRIVLLPIPNAKSLRGMLAGMDTTAERDADRV